VTIMRAQMIIGEDAIWHLSIENWPANWLEITAGSQGISNIDG
jgi:hypothetical protein